MSFYFDCIRFMRLLRKFMTFIGHIPIKRSYRTLQITVVFVVSASVPFMRLWSSEEADFQNDSELARIVNMSLLFVLCIVHVIVVLETSYKMDKFDKTIWQFEKIHKNASLFQLYCEIHSSKKPDWRAVLVYIFLVLGTLEVILLSWILHMDGYTWIRTCFTLYSDLTLKTKLFEFILFVILTNTMQNDLCWAIEKCITDYRSTPTKVWTSRRNGLPALCSIGQLRNEIWMAVKMIEDLCEYSLVGILLKLYCDITFSAYWTYRSLNSEWTNSYKAACVLFLLVRSLIIFLCYWICTSCELLERIFITKIPLNATTGSDEHLNSIIKDLSLDLLHKRIKFNAGDIIAMNVQTFGEMTFSAVIFVVILIQFQMEVSSN